MQNSWSYIKDSGDFLKEIGSVGNIPEKSILVTVNVAGLYPNILHNAGLKALHNMLESSGHKAASTEVLVPMTGFGSFNGDTEKQILGRAINWH